MSVSTCTSAPKRQTSVAKYLSHIVSIWSDREPPNNRETSSSPRPMMRPLTVTAPPIGHWRATRATSAPVAVHYRIPSEPLAKRGEPPLGMEPAGKGVAGCGIAFLLLPVARLQEA
jgi:hypothetical protein